MLKKGGSYSPYLLFLNSARSSELFTGSTFDHCQTFGVDRGELWKSAPPEVQDFFQSLADSAEMVSRHESENLAKAAARLKADSESQRSSRVFFGDEDAAQSSSRGRVGRRRACQQLSEKLQTKLQETGKHQEVLKRLMADSTIREAFTVHDLASLTGATSASLKGHSQLDGNKNSEKKLSSNSSISERNAAILAKKDDTFFGNLVTKPTTRHLEPSLQAFIVMNKANPDQAFIEQCEYLWNRKEKKGDEAEFAARFNNLRNFEKFCSHAITKFPKCHGMMQKHSQWGALGHKLVTAFIMEDSQPLGKAVFNWEELRIHERPGFHRTERIVKEVSASGGIVRTEASYRTKRRETIKKNRAERGGGARSKFDKLPTTAVPSSDYTMGVGKFKNNMALLKYVRSAQMVMKMRSPKHSCVYEAVVSASAQHRNLVSQRRLEKTYSEFGNAKL